MDIPRPVDKADAKDNQINPMAKRAIGKGSAPGYINVYIFNSLSLSLSLLLYLSCSLSLYIYIYMYLCLSVSL